MNTITGRRLPDGTLVITAWRSTMTETPKTHTREPWSIEPEPYMDDESAWFFGPHIVGPDGSVICHTSYTAFWGGNDFMEANAERIVACVNAMAGIDDPSALLAAVDALVEAADMAEPVFTRYENNVARYITASELVSIGRTLRDALVAIRAARGEA